MHLSYQILYQVSLAQPVEDGPHQQGDPGSTLTETVAPVVGGGVVRGGDTLKSSQLKTSVV